MRTRHAPIGGVLAVVAIVLGCSSGSPAASSGAPAGASEAASPANVAASPASQDNPVPPPGFSAVVNMAIGDAQPTELTGGRCENQEAPPELGGGATWALSVGTSGAADYIGIVITVPDVASVPDGEYDRENALATFNRAGAPFNVGDFVITLEAGGTKGSFTGDSRPGNEPIEATFSC